MSEEKACKKADQMEKAQGKRHGQIHAQIEPHFHGHYHGQICDHAQLNEPNVEYSPHHDFETRRTIKGNVLTVRSHSGISGDMLLTSLAVLNMLAGDIEPGSPAADEMCNALCRAIAPKLEGSLLIRAHAVNGITGWQAEVNVPVETEHRTIEQIQKLIGESGLSEAAKKRAGLCFELLAACEASVHGVDPLEVHFHEVGALDSILDICASCELYERLDAPGMVCSPLPVADGKVRCAHGLLPTPAPATLKLLENIPVRPFEGEAQAGELITPTGIALLRSLNTVFGKWPAMQIHVSTIVYGQREFADTPNGLTVAFGQRW